MKRCLICGRDEAGDAATCPACGEASWTAPWKSHEEAVADREVEPDATYGKGKRGRR